MAYAEWYQRAVLAARDVIARGGRISVSSRSFWSRHEFPAINLRRDIVRQAKALIATANEIEAGSIRGTIAQALGDAGFPTTDLAGGLTGGTSAAVYGSAVYGPSDIVARYVNQQQTGEDAGLSDAEMAQLQFRSFRRDLSFDTSIDMLAEDIADAIDDAGDAYGLENGTLAPGSFVVY